MCRFLPVTRCLWGPRESASIRSRRFTKRPCACVRNSAQPRAGGRNAEQLVLFENRLRRNAHAHTPRARTRLSRTCGEPARTARALPGPGVGRSRPGRHARGVQRRLVASTAVRDFPVRLGVCSLAHAAAAGGSAEDGCAHLSWACTGRGGQGDRRGPDAAEARVKEAVRRSCPLPRATLLRALQPSQHVSLSAS